MDILDKVIKTEQRRAFISRCLKVDICPGCGAELTQDDWGNGYDIVCIPCGTDMVREFKIFGFTYGKEGYRQGKIWDTIC